MALSRVVIVFDSWYLLVLFLQSISPATVHSNFFYSMLGREMGEAEYNILEKVRKDIGTKTLQPSIMVNFFLLFVHLAVLGIVREKY